MRRHDDHEVGEGEGAKGTEESVDSPGSRSLAPWAWRLSLFQFLFFWCEEAAGLTSVSVSWHEVRPSA